MAVIAAISTALSNAAIGLVRLSGDGAEKIAQSIFSSPLKDRTAVYGRITNKNGETLDTALCTFFKGPHSYTGEDMAEFSCHGGLVVLRGVLEAVLDAGAIPAERGEFTKRAFLNGKMDMSQSEAVIDIITAKSTLSAKEAFLQAGGSLRRVINELRSTLLDIDSEIMVYADFAAEGIEAPDASKLCPMIEAAMQRTEKLRASYNTGKFLKEGFPVCLCGKPNVGKSSLMNRLIGRDRSIVTEIAGTTRDVISETIELDGLPIVLSDTAGIHKSEDTVEKIGIDRAKEEIKNSALAIFLFDASMPCDENDDALLALAHECDSLIVANKSDKAHIFVPDGAILISAESGEGMEKLISAIKEKALGAAPMDMGETITNLRHRQALDRAYEALSRAHDAILIGIDPEVAELDINQALCQLGLITGETVSDDLIDRIYENFCVGK